MERENIIGLIAGRGRLPFLVAQGARKNGFKVICAAIADNADQALSSYVDKYFSVAIARPSSWIRKLKKNGVTETIMVGSVVKSQIFTPWRIVRYLPDWLALKIWYWNLRSKDKQSQTILFALADELAKGGIILEDSTKYCKEHLAGSGQMTKQSPNSSTQADIDFGWDIAKKVAQLDIGQAIAVREREVVAVEAIEGTAEMLKRAGHFCKKGGWTLIKVARANLDMRFDVPCIGEDTIKSMAENGGRCIVLEAGKVIIIDKPQTLALADKLGVCVVGR